MMLNIVRPQSGYFKRLKIVGTVKTISKICNHCMSVSYTSPCFS